MTDKLVDDYNEREGIINCASSIVHLMMLLVHVYHNKYELVHVIHTQYFKLHTLTYIYQHNTYIDIYRDMYISKHNEVVIQRKAKYTTRIYT
jgi:hypothetical protein